MSVWLLEIHPRSSGRDVSTLSPWAISPTPWPDFFKRSLLQEHLKCPVLIFVCWWISSSWKNGCHKNIKCPPSVGHWVFQTNPKISCYFCIPSRAVGHSFHHVHWNFLPVFNQSCKLGILESEGTFLGLLRMWECGIRLWEGGGQK